MKKVYQRTNYDCYTCCLATLLEIPYEDVPIFYGDDPFKDDWCQEDLSDVDNRIRSFLRSQGYVSYSVPVATDNYDQFLDFTNKVFRDTLVIITGRTSQRTNHCLITSSGSVWHDPCFGGLDIVGPAKGICDEDFFWVELVVKL